jgi:hypothetical protein
MRNYREGLSIKDRILEKNGSASAKNVLVIGDKEIGLLELGEAP